MNEPTGGATTPRPDGAGLSRDGAAERRGAPTGLLVGLVVLAGAYGLWGRWEALRDTPRFFIGMYGTSAWNHLKYGYADFGLAQIVTPGPAVPRDQRQHYVTHPPMVTWLSSFSLAAFGRSVWAARLPHLLCSAAAVLVLALLAARLYGRPAGLWTAVAAAALPGAVKGGALSDPLGPAFVLFVSLAALLYHRYTTSGRGRDFWLLALVCLLATLTDWPAYIMCFALAFHAVVYRSKARKLLMLVPPLVAVALFAVLFFYARSIPEAGHVFESLDAQMGKLSAAEGAEPAAAYSMKQWGVDFAKKFVRLLSPFALLAVLWALWRLPRAAFTRENRPEQHVVLLWLWPLPFVVAFHRFFFLNFYCFLVFVPAVAVTLGVLADALARGRTAAARGARVLVALGCTVFLLLWSQYARTMEEGTAEVQRLRVAWAADIEGNTALEQESAFALHYARQMRFLADRRVHERVDTPEAVAALAAEAGGKVGPLFVPLAFPVGDASFGRDLVGTHGFEVGEATARVSLGTPPAAAAASQRAADVALGGDLKLPEVLYALATGAKGTRLLYLGPTLERLPRKLPGDAVEWQVRFVDAAGTEAGSAAMLAKPSASYFVAVPKGWDAKTGRAELMLRLRTTDAASVGRKERLMRFALRFLTARMLGSPKPRVREFGVGGTAPIVLSGL